MLAKSFVPALAVAFVLGLASTSAHALTVTWEQINTDNGAVPASILAANNLDGTISGTGGASLGVTAGGTGITSPWTNTAAGDDRAFLYVQQNAAITFDLVNNPANGGLPATGGSLIWGTVGESNTLTLLSGGQVVHTFVPPFALPSLATYAVTFSGVVFDQLVFTHTASGGSFEFANLSVTPVPLPAAAVLFLSGLLAMFVVGRRRNRSQIGPHSLA